MIDDNKEITENIDRFISEFKQADWNGVLLELGIDDDTAIAGLIAHYEAAKGMLDLMKEIDDYLNINELTSIGHGSILHKKVKSFLPLPTGESE